MPQAATEEYLLDDARWYNGSPRRDGAEGESREMVVEDSEGSGRGGLGGRMLMLLLRYLEPWGAQDRWKDQPYQEGSYDL